jgi:signal transduction histidine kinase
MMPLRRLNSLALRLVLAAALWIGAALLAGGLALSAIFRGYAERNFDARLTVLLESLVAVTELDDQGRPQLTRGVGEPRFDQPYSGWYWEIDGGGEPLLRSRSLWDERLPLAAGTVTSVEPLYGNVDGPNDEALRVVEREFVLPGALRRYHYAVGGDHSEIDEEVRSFNRTLFWSLGILGLGLLTALLIQVRFGLQPLRRMRQAIVAVRTGRAQRLDGEFPVEITPLSDELNTLIEHNAAVLERARTQVSNLAHALKTPLSVLTNEAALGAGPLAETVKRQTTSMRRHVDHYLSRARAAAATRVIGVRTDVAPVVEDLRRTLERIHVDRGIAIEADVAGDLAFRGERQDLEEMLGNLMDNACKWADARVTVGVRADADRIVFDIDDDGAGLPADQRAGVFDRGRRLDESVPGSGLGLAIVRDIAELYSGTIALGDSPLGGLRAVLTLPAALR